MANTKQRNLLKFIFFLSIFGIILSGYLTYLHYSELNSPCDFSETLSCSLVNRSQYAEFFGIPVSLMGLAGYLFLGFISLGLYYKDKIYGRNKLLNQLLNYKTILIVSLLAVFFSFYLTYAEFFLIKAVCVLCVLSQITILGISAFSYRYHYLIKKRGD